MSRMERGYVIRYCCGAGGESRSHEKSGLSSSYSSSLYIIS